ncbi:hypothetical protein [Longimicrobium terrae]|uniref:Uncharacterized protein n=1 Tax=Longimicrobium terrae TaxID=1639882 RepID=A0A841GUK9_9BACT|nr:hypothetical protein [Longimicrobium terrae]MBB4634417.1 hypothetical protein [Longimicrobium terrae]MBB6068693.1 hypothetical protein [Longimicrobium terrae]NNC27879.1 hypothetical protein [Longimicrobium terrae]
MLSFRPAAALSACALVLSACGPNEPEPDVPAAASTGTAAAPAAATGAMNPSDPFGTAPGTLGGPAPGTAAAPMAGPVAAAPPVAGQMPSAPPSPSAAPARRDSASRRPGTQRPPPPVVTDLIKQMPVSDYRLSMEGLAKMRQAALNLADLQRTNPELASSLRMQQFNPDEVYERLNSIPAAREAVQRAGMAPRDYANAMTALVQAMVVHQISKAGQTAPIQANEANVRFIAEHEAEVMQMLRPPPGQARPPQAAPPAPAAPPSR